MTTELLIENLGKILAEYPQINLVYLFGSRVAGRIGPMSDYDIAILVDANSGDFDILMKFQHSLVEYLKTERVDVIVLNRAPIDLAYNIIANGKWLYQKDRLTRVEYEARVLSKYGDFLPVLRSFKAQTLQGDAAYAKRVQWYREALGRTERTLSAPRTAKR